MGALVGTSQDIPSVIFFWKDLQTSLYSTFQTSLVWRLVGAFSCFLDPLVGILAGYILHLYLPEEFTAPCCSICHKHECLGLSLISQTFQVNPRELIGGFGEIVESLIGEKVKVLFEWSLCW